MTHNHNSPQPTGGEDRMKDALSVQELKALCRIFYDEGLRQKPFEAFFDIVMEGRYNKAIELEALQFKWEETQAQIQKEMDSWDEQQRGKAAQAMIDLSKIIITH